MPEEPENPDLTYDTWTELRQIFAAYQEALFLSELMTSVIGPVLEDLPQNVPTGLAAPIMEDLKAFGEIVAGDYDDEAIRNRGDFEEALNEGDILHITLPHEGNGDAGRYFEPSGSLFKRMRYFSLTRLLSGLEFDKVAIDQRVEEQQFVMAHSALDAYLSDLGRTALFHQPRLIKSDKQLTFEEIVQTSDREELLTLLASETTSSWSHMALWDRIEGMAKRFSIEVSGGVDSELLKAASQARNCLVHAQGKKTRKYVKQRGLPATEVGTRLSLESEELRAYRDEYEILARVFLKEVTDKFYPQEAQQELVEFLGEA